MTSSWAHRRLVCAALLTLASGGCLSSGGGADTQATVPPTDATRSATAAEPAGELPLDAPCTLRYDGTVADQLAGSCVPSCAFAMRVADLATNPGLNDIFGFDVAYVRLTTTAGHEPPPGEPLKVGDSVIESLGAYTDRSDPNVPKTKVYYAKWGPTGVPAAEAEVVYDVFWLIDDAEVSAPDGVAAVRHPLRETAQFLYTPFGCVHNPDRMADTVAAAERAASTSLPPSSTTEVPSTLGDLPPYHTSGPSGSGCSPGLEALPDGWWYGRLKATPIGATLRFDLACFYFGEAADPVAAARGDLAEDGYYVVDDNPKIRELPVSQDANALCVTLDNETYECSVAAIDGQFPIWVRVTNGSVDRVVDQYIP